MGWLVAFADSCRRWVILAIVIDRLTEYFTGTEASPVNDIKRAADTGPATLILNGDFSWF